MNDYLKHYKVKIHVLSLIHIGSGSKIGKKEYIYMPWNHRVIIPDVEKMYADLQRKGLATEFMRYMMDGSSKAPSLAQWLGEKKFREADYEKWKRYEMDAGEAFVSGESRPKEIDAFVKDAYGLPYVPGSSIKGMFRTALIAREVKNHPEKYTQVKRSLQRKSAEKAGRKVFLAKETKELEQQIFYTLHNDEKNAGNAVNDNLSGLHVGDSAPIALKQLTLSQKIDYNLKGLERPFPLLRETLIPGTEICFEVSIDTTICPYQMEEILEALEDFQKLCYQYFYSRFRRGSDAKGIVWLGGGCGFLSKTILYPMFGIDAVKIIDNIYKNTLNEKLYREHKHAKDLTLKLAPHVCKCTRYRGELYDMGMGRIEAREV